MMYTTLEDLEYHTHTVQKPKKTVKSLWKELKIFVSLFLFLFFGMYFFTNAQLIRDNLSDIFAPEVVVSVSDQIVPEDASIDQMLLSVEGQQQELAEIENMIDQYASIVPKNVEIAPSVESLLEGKLKEYTFQFNTLPPVDRLVISSIGLDVPVVASDVKDYEEFTNGMFDEELENGVVKYPTSPNPGQGGNTFLFGHTSQESWKSNPYGTVFRNIPKLQPGDVVEVVWEGQLYRYEVIETVIVYPKQVNEQYFRYQGSDYLTLMGCYPIGRSDKRMMVFAKLIK